ncbi:MAG: glycosyltransferase family 4 protein [Desulfobacteraceae bacterium]|nr:glycosyltransferase family 4 protein [Desulfobacteraceae bacterium]
MRLAVIRRECGFGFGGAEAYCANICRWLSRLGHEVTVVADRSRVECNFSRAKVFGRGSILKNLSFFFNVKKVLEKDGFDLTYGLSRVAPVDILRISDPLHAAWLELGYGGVSKLRCLRPRHKALLWMESRAIEESRAVVAISNLVKRQLRQYYNVPSSNIHVVYNGIDLEAFYPMSPGERIALRLDMGIPESDTILLFAGSDLRRKGLKHLIDGLKGLRRRDFTLLIAGSYGDRAIDAEIKRAEFSAKVRWLGYVKDMRRLYSASDLFILPTLYDTFANTVLESMACGTPALTTQSAGACELAGEVAGWLVLESASAHDVYNALRHFFGLSDEARGSLGERALAIAKRYSWESHVRILQGIFEANLS